MEDRYFVKSDLRRIALVVLGILVLFGVLYYLETSSGALTKLLP